MTIQNSAVATDNQLVSEYLRVRGNSLLLCDPLEVEDFGLQAMANTSPVKWHLAHTTWFFETFVLKAFSADYEVWNRACEQLFNSYYNSIGNPFPRHRRGLLSRPTVKEVFEYRRVIDGRILDLLEAGTAPEKALAIVELGLHHEQQHQELMLTDLKYNFHKNPLQPVYQKLPEDSPLSPLAEADWLTFEGGLVTLGNSGDGFCFDNETPAHCCFLAEFQLASRPVSNREYMAFIADGGYREPGLWLADGWDTVCQQSWTAPLYWECIDGQWFYFTLGGRRPVNGSEPVSHLSFYEADAYARWAGARLPTEFEWEHAAAPAPFSGNFLNDSRYHPRPSVNRKDGITQLFGDVWEWTSSAYLPYPGYRPPPGAVGEYNGKFMSGQMVLRGGSCVSDRHHIRPSYRNFFYPRDQWQFSGMRLARSV